MSEYSRYEKRQNNPFEPSNHQPSNPMNLSSTIYLFRVVLLTEIVLCVTSGLLAYLDAKDQKGVDREILMFATVGEIMSHLPGIVALMLTPLRFEFLRIFIAVIGLLTSGIGALFYLQCYLSTEQGHLHLILFPVKHVMFTVVLFGLLLVAFAISLATVQREAKSVSPNSPSEEWKNSGGD